MPLKVRKIYQRILVFLSGAFVLYSTAYLFDYVLYPFVIYKAGLLKGFAIMLALSFLSCLIFLLIYNFLKKDIFALEYSKQKINAFIDDTKGSKIKRFFRKILKHSKILLFIFLSVYDPFIATVFMRKGDFKPKLMTRSDWGILSLSVVVGNAVWAPTIFVGVSLFEFLYELIA